MRCNGAEELFLRQALLRAGPLPIVDDAFHLRAIEDAIDSKTGTHDRVVDRAENRTGRDVHRGDQQPPLSGADFLRDVEVDGPALAR